MKTAVIGIGSNSVRMLLAEVEDHVGRRLRRDRAGTRLFAGLAADRRLQQDSMDATADAVASMAASARADGAQEVRLFATSATRDAANAGEFASLLRHRAKVELEVCSGEEEAALSFLGATGGGDCGVIDIGGGSTEVVLGDGESLRCAFSCQMGAVRLYRRMPITCRDDVERVVAAADDILRENLAKQPPLVHPQLWVGTGGTFTTLAAMLNRVPWTDRTCMHGTALTLPAVEEEAALLADLPVEERLKLPGLQPSRADIVVHGICILIACMHRLEIASMRVSEYGNLDGYLKKHYALTGWEC